MTKQQKYQAHRGKKTRLTGPTKLGPLGAVRGTLTENAPLGAQSWFRCGGAADLLFEPADIDDLAAFLSHHNTAPSPLGGEGWGEGGPDECEGDKDSKHREAPPHPTPLPEGRGGITVLGGLANTIIRDGGVRGIVVQLGKPFAAVSVMDERYIHAGAGALNGTVAAAAAKAGIGGLEFLSGIPGTVGGALAMNAGAYGTEVKDVLIGAEALNSSGESQKFTVDDLNMSYRHTDVPDGTVFMGAIFKGQCEDKVDVKARLKDIKKKRNDTQPISEKTGGSTFANPSAIELEAAGLPEGTRAWQVVEMVDGRGFSIGGAQMSEKHCNFMINTGDATANDLEMLGDELRTRARAKFGLDLHWEIRRIGERKG